MIAKQKPYLGFEISRGIPAGWLTFIAKKDGKIVATDRSVTELKHKLRAIVAVESQGQPDSSATSA